MDFAMVLAILEEEKRGIVSEMRQIKRDHGDHPGIDKAIRRFTGDISYEDDIARLREQIDEFSEAIRILNLAKSVENL